VEQNKLALITGVTGQDGYYLSYHLLSLGYQVVGIKRRSSVSNDERIRSLYTYKNFSVEIGDVTDPSYMCDVVSRYKPDELYNLAAQSHVKESFSQPITTHDIVFGGCQNCLEAIRLCSPSTKFYQASSSEMFGSSYSEIIEIENEHAETMYYQDEHTPFLPNSPYAVAKLAAHNLVRVYREAYNIFACCGILFNHESPLRAEAFVTRKISKFVGSWLKTGPHFGKLKLGNLDAQRDWGHAEDYVRGMHLMLQYWNPDDYVLATGETRTIRHFLTEAFLHAGIKDWQPYVEIDESLKRPMEVPYLRGCADKAKKVLGWVPKISFGELVREMVEHDSES